MVELEVVSSNSYENMGIREKFNDNEIQSLSTALDQLSQNCKVD